MAPKATGYVNMGPPRHKVTQPENAKALPEPESESFHYI